MTGSLRTLTRCIALLLCAAPLLGWAAPHGLDSEWLSVNKEPTNQRYVALDQINRDTIAKLGAIWVSAPFADGASSRMTPVVHAGRMFLGAGPRIYALDARSGELIWSHQMETRKPTGSSQQEMVMSGLAVTRSWGLGLGGGMVFAGLVNGHVIALRETSGEVVWDKLINDEPLAISQGIVCPPLYLDGVLYFGLGGEATRSYIAAVDAKSGRVLWRISTIDPGQPGHETWPLDSEVWRSGGAHPWVAGAADPSLGLVYFGTSNAGPSQAGKFRRGDNLYSVALLAVEMKTGKLRWYRQLVHHDVWEADLSIPPVLFDGEVDGQARKGVAIMRADGYLFEFDRATGAPLIPIEERPVPQNPAIFTAPTQPFPRGAESILPPCERWRSKIPTGFILGCTFDPPSEDVPNLLAQWASVRIAPMAYSPQTGYFYAQGTSSLEWRRTHNDPWGALVNASGERVLNYPKATGVVAAVDGRSGKVVWRKELPTAVDGFARNSGALSTAGRLVFHEGGDGSLQAYDAGTGETLWRFQTDFASGASPMSYAIDGEQYVAFVAGSKIWAFALGGTLPQASAIAPLPQEEITGPIEDTNQIETLTFERMLASGLRYYANEYAFNPYRARVRAGAPITFINNGFLPHTITARDGSWTTRTLAPTQIATITFDKPGSYFYTSKEYPWSSGEIIVLSVTASSTTAAEAATSEQVALGKTVYAASCSACHGENLGGRDPSPALSGRGFSARWTGRAAIDLFNRIRTTMPPTAPATLSDDQYAAIVSYILHANNNPARVTLDRQTMKAVNVTSAE